MADNQLTATTGSGQQTTTQSPQAAGQAAATGTKSSSLQPGTATALLNSQNGVPLNATPLSTVSLNPATSSVTTTTKQIPRPQHHFNPIFFSVPILLIVVVVILFWVVGRPEKTTT